MENAESTASVLARLGYLSPPHETSNSTAPHPDATFLVSPSKGQNPSPAVAEPAKPSPAPLAVVPAAAEVPEASKRGDKLTRGGIADPTAVANPVVQVKSHLRLSGNGGGKGQTAVDLGKVGRRIRNGPTADDGARPAIRATLRCVDSLAAGKTRGRQARSPLGNQVHSSPPG